MKNFIKKMDFYDRFMILWFLFAIVLFAALRAWEPVFTQTVFLGWLMMFILQKQRAQVAEEFSEKLWDWMMENTRKAKKEGKRAYLTIDEKAGVFEIEAE